MTTANLFTRDDTFFGICEGLGQDLRIPANLLRVGFAVSLLASPVAALAIYLGLGVVLFAARTLFPVAKRTAPVAAKAAPVADNDTHAVAFAKAA